MKYNIIIDDKITYKELWALFEEMKAYKGEIPISDLFHYEWRTAEQDKIMLDNSIFITIRNLDNKLIASLRLVSDKSYTYYLTDVMVTPEYQKQGLGSILINKAIDYCKKNGFMKIFLATPPNNEEYYKKFGFKETMCKHLEIKFAKEIKYI
jgi:N-acetylglutamate synthase-like GNAT family acetyltransferase